MKSIVLFILLGSLPYLLEASHSDEVKELPGLNFTLNYKHYSGYLNATSGRFLHYWFVESQRSPSKDPVVLWLNGGPGCSSMEGFLNELGPLHVNDDGKTLYNNTYAWNRVANVVFLESPVGVGFSYADNKKYATDDDTVSYDNYVALQHFFQKFPQFKRNEFYIAGESYGGIYIPTLSVRVLMGPAEINFKGFAIGNGYLDTTNLTNSVIFFAYHHGLVGNKVWNQLSEYCCGGKASVETCDFANPESSDCKEAVGEVTQVIEGGGLNIYNLYSDCEESKDEHSRYLVDKRYLLKHLSKSKTSYRASQDPPCVDSSSLRKYLNQESVRSALHIPSDVQTWELCSEDVEIQYRSLYQSMRPQILKLIESGKLRILIYNGDVDMACNFLGDEWFSFGLNLKVKAEYKPWTFHDQIAGFVKQYEILTYLTIKGSGHMVPMDKPGPAFKMIDTFLSNKAF